MNETDRSTALHDAMSRPDFYPPPCRKVSWEETHVSRLYFTENSVYKIKKPVDYGFLDFTTLASRRHACEEEVRLNRRLAPGMYRGAVPITHQQGQFSLCGTGRPVEWAVWMERLPQEKMLDFLLRTGDPALPRAIPRVARALAEFHATAEIVSPTNDSEHLRTLRCNWDENFNQTRPFTGDTLPPNVQVVAANIVDEALSEEGLAPLIRARAKQGLVRDGHGDLHAEHICLTRPLRIYDCIEFNRRFREDDVLADLAFLCMDLDYHGRRDLRDQLLHSYARRFPEAAGPPALVRLYSLYRAWVRGKVDSFLANSPGLPDGPSAAALRRARAHFALAMGYTAPPSLIIVCGLMGSGKTTLARRLAWATGALQLRSDVVRKELAGVPAGTVAHDPYGRGLYRQELTTQTYDELFRRIRARLRRGEATVVDASFGEARQRQRFLAAARGKGVPALLVYCHCPADIARQRLAHRVASEHDASDGRPELYAVQAASFALPHVDEGAVSVDTTQDVDYTVALLLGRLSAPFKAWSAA